MRDHRRRPLTGLYVILDPQAVRGRDLADCLALAADAGAGLFQYRDKVSSGRDLYRQAERLREAATRLGVMLIINDRCDVALAVDADGVHLGQDDLPPRHARALLGPSKIIGVSTHAAREVEAAARCDVNYVGFGPIFRTTTKADHQPVVGLDGLAEARRLTTLPLFAIGGIGLDDMPRVMALGPDGVAVISGIWSRDQPSSSVRAFIESLAQSTRPRS